MSVFQCVHCKQVSYVTVIIQGEGLCSSALPGSANHAWKAYTGTEEDLIRDRQLQDSASQIDRIKADLEFIGVTYNEENELVINPSKKDKWVRASLALDNARSERLTSQIAALRSALEKASGLLADIGTVMERHKHTVKSLAAELALANKKLEILQASNDNYARTSNWRRGLSCERADKWWRSDVNGYDFARKTQEEIARLEGEND